MSSDEHVRRVSWKVKSGRSLTDFRIAVNQRETFRVSVAARE